MSLLDSFFDSIQGMAGTAPSSNPALRQLRKEHDQWLRNAELHRTYYGVGAEAEWIWLENAPEPTIVIDNTFTFTRTLSKGMLLVTDEGISSWTAFQQSPRGLTSVRPPLPRKPRDLAPNFHGDLHDPSTWGNRG
jgi:hypothetical protein